MPFQKGYDPARHVGGRKKSIVSAEQYKEALALLDRNTVSVLKRLILLTKSKNEKVRVKACQVYLDRCLPTMKSIDNRVRYEPDINIYHHDSPASLN